MKRWALAFPLAKRLKDKTFWIQSFILCDCRNKASLGRVVDKNKRHYIATLDFASLICTILYFLVTGFIQKRRETGLMTLWQPGESKVPIPARWKFPFGYINSKEMTRPSFLPAFIHNPFIFKESEFSCCFMPICFMADR